MKQIILFAIILIFPSCSLIQHEGRKKETVDSISISVIKEDSLNTLFINSKIDSLSDASLKSTLINLISSQKDINVRIDLINDYKKFIGTDYYADIKSNVAKNLSGDWILTGETFTDTITINDNTQLNFTEPNLLTLVYDNSLLYLTVTKDKLGGFYNDEKIYLEKVK